jgi:ABC transporter, permease/ATP-binding protein
MRTVANAYKIVVLKDGTVAEQGIPAELMARGGEFARMVERQKGRKAVKTTKKQFLINAHRDLERVLEIRFGKQRKRER